MKQEFSLHQDEDLEYYIEDVSDRPAICSEGVAWLLRRRNFANRPSRIKVTFSNRDFPGAKRVKFAYDNGLFELRYFHAGKPLELFSVARQKITETAPKTYLDGRPFYRFVEVEPITA